MSWVGNTYIAYSKVLLDWAIAIAMVGGLSKIQPLKTLGRACKILGQWVKPQIRTAVISRTWAANTDWGWGLFIGLGSQGGGGGVRLQTGMLGPSLCQNSTSNTHPDLVSLSHRLGGAGPTGWVSSALAPGSKWGVQRQRKTCFCSSSANWRLEMSQ